MRLSIHQLRHGIRDSQSLVEITSKWSRSLSPIQICLRSYRPPLCNTVYLKGRRTNPVSMRPFHSSAPLRQLNYDGEDPYKVLGVSKTADAKEIRAAFLKKAKQFHPDVNKGNPSAQKQFVAATAAYEILRDPQKRKEYDMQESFGFGRQQGQQYQYRQQQGRPYGQQQQQYQYRQQQGPFTDFNWQGGRPEDFMNFYSKHYKDIFEDLEKMFGQEFSQGGKNQTFRSKDGNVFFRVESFGFPGGRGPNASRGAFDNTFFNLGMRPFYDMFDNLLRGTRTISEEEQRRILPHVFHLAKERTANKLHMLFNSQLIGSVTFNDRTNTVELVYPDRTVARGTIVVDTDVATTVKVTDENGKLLSTITSTPTFAFPFLNKLHYNYSVTNKDGAQVAVGKSIHLFGLYENFTWFGTGHRFLMRLRRFLLPLWSVVSRREYLAEQSALVLASAMKMLKR